MAKEIVGTLRESAPAHCGYRSLLNTCSEQVMADGHRRLIRRANFPAGPRSALRV